MKRFLYLLHRRCGLIVALPVVFWTLSGILHPTMSWLRPVPATMTPLPIILTESDLSYDLGETLQRHGVGLIQSASLVTDGERTLIRVVPADGGEPRHFDLRDGSERPNGEAAWAERLARHYAGEPNAAVVSNTVLTHFVPEYREINQYMPVRRVEFDRADRLRVYLDPQSGALGSLVDRTRGWLTQGFAWFHNWTFLDEIVPSWIRPVALVGLSILALISGVSGLLTYSLVRTKIGKAAQAGGLPIRTRLRLAHRTLGVLISLAFVMFAASGLHHALHKEIRTPQPDTSANGPALDPSTFAVGLKEAYRLASETGPIVNLAIVSLPDGPAYRFAHPVARSPKPLEPASGSDQSAPSPLPVATYIHAQTGTKLSSQSDLVLARRLATEWTGYPADLIVSSELVATFSMDYPMIFRRLPVVKVTFDTPNRETLFIDPAWGVLARHLVSEDIPPALTFHFLHKWHFLDFMGKDARDGVMVAFCGGIALATGLGAATWCTGLRRRGHRNPAA